jgi:hypothetical protein
VAVTGAWESGITNRGGRLTIISCEIEDNDSEVYGGGIENRGGYLNIKNSKISNNTAGEAYGGIFSHTWPPGNIIAKLTISDSIISGNASLGAGGIGNAGGILIIKRSEIIDNDSWVYCGGGILNFSTVDGITDAKIMKSTIAGNEAGNIMGEGCGAGIYNYGDMVIINSDISDNTANYESDPSPSGGSGGGIINEGSLLIKRSTISGNESGVTGGGIDNSGDLTVIKSVITENTALASGASGGGIYNDGTVTLKKTIIENNVPDDCVNCQ